MNEQNYPADLRKLIELHGHLCIGSVIGYRVCKYALKLVDKGPGLSVITGSGGCLLHAIEILTGCSRENGSVIRTEEQGWGFYDHVSGEGYRFTLKSELFNVKSGKKDIFIQTLLSLPDNDIFNVQAFEYAGHSPKNKNA
ncbi:MAG: FmdE family protein [Bacillota bacterium]